MHEALEAYRQAVAELTGAGGRFELRQVGGADTRRFAGTAPDVNTVAEGLVADFADNVFCEYEGERRSYADIFGAASRLAAGLRDEHHITVGDRVGIAMHNCPHWLIAFFAVLRLGAVAVLINSRSTGTEMMDAAGSVDCRLVLADARCAERLADVSTSPVVGHGAVDALIAGAPAQAAPAHPAQDAPAMILFTSGTTGRPKGAALTQRNVCAMMRLNAYLRHLGLTLAAARLGRPAEQLIAAAPPASYLGVMPMFHISGVINMISAALTGGTLALMRRWDAAVAIDLIDRNEIANLSGPSMIIADILDQPEAARRLACLRSVVVGGQASPIALSDRIRALLPGTGQAAGYGMTELTGSITSAAGAIFSAYPGSVGVVLPLADVRLRGPDGRDVGIGEPGEVAVRGPLVMRGYWGDAGANSEAFDGEWFLTGDIGRFDEDGVLYLVDRAKDLVISAGENIYCAEVERVMSMIADFTEVALFGVPDERLGERTLAAVCLRDGSDGTWDNDAVRTFVAQHLAAYKVPAEVLFDLGPLPRNATGKVDKVALRRRYHDRATAGAIAHERIS